VFKTAIIDLPDDLMFINRLYQHSQQFKHCHRSTDAFANRITVANQI
jgi:hypothetical protein